MWENIRKDLHGFAKTHPRLNVIQLLFQSVTLQTTTNCSPSISRPHRSQPQLWSGYPPKELIWVLRASQTLFIIILKGIGSTTPHGSPIGWPGNWQTELIWVLQQKTEFRCNAPAGSTQTTTLNHISQHKQITYRNKTSQTITELRHLKPQK